MVQLSLHDSRMKSRPTTHGRVFALEHLNEGRDKINLVHRRGFEILKILDRNHQSLTKFGRNIEETTMGLLVALHEHVSRAMDKVDSICCNAFLILPTDDVDSWNQALTGSRDLRVKKQEPQNQGNNPRKWMFRNQD